MKTLSVVLLPLYLLLPGTASAEVIGPDVISSTHIETDAGEEGRQQTDEEECS